MTKEKDKEREREMDGGMSEELSEFLARQGDVSRHAV